MQIEKKRVLKREEEKEYERRKSRVF